MSTPAMNKSGVPFNFNPKLSLRKSENGLQRLIAEIHREFEKNDICIETIKKLMSSYKCDPADWKSFAKWDRYRYTRNLVDEGNGKFNLILVCWGEGHGSAIHDHADAHCFMRILQGTLSEIRFEWPKSSDLETTDTSVMRECGRTEIKNNDVCYINDSLGLHRVENPSHADTAVSLHLYSPPFNTCHVFNQNTGQASLAKVTFWSKFGHRDRTNQSRRDPEDN